MNLNVKLLKINIWQWFFKKLIIASLVWTITWNSEFKRSEQTENQ